MFTGIIEEVGKIKNIKRYNRYQNITIQAKQIFSDLKIGDSVAVDGSCLTATEIGDNWFSAQISPETLGLTKAKFYRPGIFVNLERAMKLQDRIGGHLVQGHVEGTAKINYFSKSRGQTHLVLKIPPSLNKNIVTKGFLAVDGISLTIVEIKGNLVEFTIIDQTLKSTTLKNLHPGEIVNIERDFSLIYGR